MATLKIAPMNRLEGHMDIDATTNTVGTDEVVATVDNKVVMFRGIENIAQLRDPRDMPIITPRT